MFEIIILVMSVLSLCSFYKRNTAIQFLVNVKEDDDDPDRIKLERLRELEDP